MRICFITAPGEVGGLERVVHGQAIGLHRAGHEVHVIAVLSPEPADAPFSRPLRAAGVALHEVRLPPGPRYFLAERRAVRRLLRSLRPEVVHTHGYRSDILDGGLAQGLGLPVVTTIHGESFMGGRTTLYEWLQWRAYRRFDAVVAVSRPLEATARRHRVPRERLHLIPNAWPGGVEFLGRAEARAALGLPAEGLVVGWLGRMIPVKGADVFLGAMGSAPHGAAHLALIGDGPQRAALEQQAAAAGLGDRVRFAGAIEHGARYMRAFDLFVLSSRSEGTPIVLFEAMAAGVPVVASAVGGVPDVLGEGAWLVPPEAPAALRAAIDGAAGDAEARAAQARRAADRLATTYATERWLDAHLALYARIRDARAPRRAGPPRSFPPPPAT